MQARVLAHLKVRVCEGAFVCVCSCLCLQLCVCVCVCVCVHGCVLCVQPHSHVNKSVFMRAMLRVSRRVTVCIWAYVRVRARAPLPRLCPQCCAFCCLSAVSVIT